MSLHVRHGELLVEVGDVGLRLHPIPRQADDMVRARTRPGSEDAWVDALGTCGWLVAYSASGLLVAYNLPGSRFRNILLDLWNKTTP